jgi:long-chain acyl-CoA synthetase
VGDEPLLPEAIEAHYERSPFIREIAVVWSSAHLHALVRPDLDILRQRRIVNMRELLRFEIEGLSLDLPERHRIARFEVTLQDLPRTAAGKLARCEVEKRLRAFEDRLRPSSDRAPVSREEAEWAAAPGVARLLTIVCDVVPPGLPLRSDAHLELDLGLDSMDRVALLAHVCHAEGVTLRADAEQQICTLRDLVDVVVANATPAAGSSTAAARDTWRRLLTRDAPDERLVRQLRRPRPFAAIFFFCVGLLIRFVLRLGCRLEVRGIEHLPSAGGYLVCPNHQSYIDGVLIPAIVPFRVFRRMFFVGASEYFESPFMRRLAYALDIVPVDPDANLVRALQAGAAGLRSGRVLTIFPEGERSIDGSVRRFRKGAVILSHELGVPIVPVGIEGTFDVWPRKRPFNWRALVPGAGPRIRVWFGRPVMPPSGEQDYAAGTERLRDRVAELREAAMVG